MAFVVGLDRLLLARSVSIRISKRSQALAPRSHRLVLNAQKGSGAFDDEPESSFFEDELKRLEKELSEETVIDEQVVDTGGGEDEVEWDSLDDEDRNPSPLEDSAYSEEEDVIDSNEDEDEDEDELREQPIAASMFGRYNEREDVETEDDAEIDFEKELDMEFINLARELEFDSPEELLEALTITSPYEGRPPSELLGMDDPVEAPEGNAEGQFYRNWRPEAYMSSEDTAIVFDVPIEVDGVVTEGFGRGSRKIGVPTANIEAAVLGVTLAKLENGVYFGWARVGEDAEIHGTVLNIGINPTFGDVKKRVLEAHILSDFQEDFYGERLMVLISGFLRKEHKFDGFPELVRNIKNDLLTGIIMLKRNPVRAYRKHPFLQRDSFSD